MSRRGLIYLSSFKDIVNEMGDNLEKSVKEIGSNIVSGIKEVGNSIDSGIKSIQKVFGW